MRETSEVGCFKENVCLSHSLFQVMIIFEHSECTEGSWLLYFGQWVAKSKQHLGQTLGAASTNSRRLRGFAYQSTSRIISLSPNVVKTDLLTYKVYEQFEALFECALMRFVSSLHGYCSKQIGFRHQY